MNYVLITICDAASSDYSTPQKVFALQSPSPLPSEASLEERPWKPLLTSEKRFRNDLSPALPGDLPGLGYPLPCLCQLQGCQDQERQRVRQKSFVVLLK